VFSPNVACGKLSDEIQITALVRNQGDLRVGPGVTVEFIGIWTDSAEPIALVDEQGKPLVVTVSKSLEPGASLLTPAVTYKASFGGKSSLPTQVMVVVDGEKTALECVETNNSITGSIDPGEALADLRLVVTKATDCAPPKIDFTVYNDGALPASNVLVRIFAGDPSSGGTALGETVVAGPIAPSSSATGQVTASTLSRDVVVWGVADPKDEVLECNDANNIAQGPSLNCGSIILQ
jgi:hypothetical protein